MLIKSTSSPCCPDYFIFWLRAGFSQRKLRLQVVEDLVRRAALYSCPAGVGELLAIKYSETSATRASTDVHSIGAWRETVFGNFYSEKVMPVDGVLR